MLKPAVKWDCRVRAILFEVKCTLVDGKLWAIGHVLHVQIQAETGLRQAVQFSLLYNPFLNHQHPLPEMKVLPKCCSTGVRRP